MKKSIYLIIFLLAVNLSKGQTKFSISYSQGFGSLPTFSNYTDDQLVSIKQAVDIFNYVKDEIGIEFKYSYAGCEKRAHAVSLLLNAKKIKHYKIWNFDPMLVSLFNKSQKPTAASKAGLSPNISWAYHVAILVFVKEGKEVVPMVVDPALSDEIITQQKWLDLQNAPKSYFTILDPVWYNYATTDKFKYYCNNTAYPLPPCMDGLLTGDFFRNDGISLQEMWVEEALAVNEVAIKMIKHVLKENPASDKRKVFVNLIENFDGLTNALRGTIVSDEIKPYKDFLAPFQKQFASSKSAWKKKLDAVR